MSPEELLELSLKLSQEKLYIQTERETIARLNQDVSAAAAQVDSSDIGLHTYRNLLLKPFQLFK